MFRGRREWLGRQGVRASMRSTTSILASSLGFLALVVAGGGAAIASGKMAYSYMASAAPPPQVGSFPTDVVPGQYATETFTAPDGQQMTYYLYVPANYSANEQYPLVLLLHGGGERSSSKKTAEQNRTLLLSQQYVKDWIAPNVQSHWPSFVVVPQVAGSARWVNVPASRGSYTMRPQPTASLQLAMDIVATVRQAYPSVDSDRMYVTGLSMGGYGVWDAIERWPSLFAAAVPLAGAGDPDRASVLVNLPIWDFHGTVDKTVPVSGSRQMIAAIRIDGGSPRYTEYPGQDHGIWNSERVYANPKLLRWLFSQTKAPAAHIGAQRAIS